jgi:amino-acid N-acetyltransferase
MSDQLESPPITVIPGRAEFLGEVEAFLQPFVDQEFLLPRTREELSKLLTLSFVAVRDNEIVGFAAVEIYSRKLAEIQCLAVLPSLQRQGIGRQLVQGCVDIARQQGVKELMAISASDAMFVACGFHYSLPNQKRALFVSPQEMGESGSSPE